MTTMILSKSLAVSKNTFIGVLKHYKVQVHTTTSIMDKVNLNS